MINNGADETCQVYAKVLRSESHVHARVMINNGADETCQVYAKVLRSESRVHARDTVNGGADETHFDKLSAPPSAGLRESLAFGVPRPREGHD
jgi:hypothetical protein